MILSDRLQAVVDMVSPGHRVADVGCDHAYISIYLIKNKISNKVIAMDVNPGPLEIAKNNISKEKALEDKIETRLSDGLENLSTGEVDTVIIAGMGGGLTCKILQEAGDKLYSIKELVLQPQSEVDLVRKLLERLKIPIIKEKMLIEDGKYYLVIKALTEGQTQEVLQEQTQGHLQEQTQEKTQEQTQEQTQAQTQEKTQVQEVIHQQELIKKSHHLYGKYLLENQDPILHKYLLDRKESLSIIKNKLENLNTKNAKDRLNEINREIECVNIGLSYYDT